MAVSLSTNFVTLFDAEVKQAYQAQQQLAGTCRTRTGVVGSTVTFPLIGKGVAGIRIPQTDVTPLNIAHTNVSATLADYAAPEYTDIFDQTHVNYEERQELVQVVAGAIGRRADQIKLDAMVAATPTATVSNDIGGTDSNLNVAKIREAKRQLDANNVPAGDRFFLMSADGLANLLSETEISSSDFNTVRSLVNGSVDSFLGFKFIMMGDRDEGGLSIDGSSDRTAFAWHKDAMGYAESMAQSTEINYVAEKTSWLVTGKLSAGSVAIDPEGLVEITTRE
mgnify:FL=1|jgi:hypothetical protein|tara:strand:- start:4074 stop:4913 length:840 start_codon:yes stop_codon:yes gene_type:complete